MIDRIGFIRGAIASLLALVGLRLPLKAEPDCDYDGICDSCYEEPAVDDGLCQLCIDEDENMGDSLWPNDKPFYCVGIPRDVSSVGLLNEKSPGCPVCRRNYNRKIINSEPDWYGAFVIDNKTGMWTSPNHVAPTGFDYGDTL